MGWCHGSTTGKPLARLPLNSEARVLCSWFYQKLCRSILTETTDHNLSASHADPPHDMFSPLLARSVGRSPLFVRAREHTCESFGVHLGRFRSVHYTAKYNSMRLSCEESGTAAVSSPRGGIIHSTPLINEAFPRTPLINNHITLTQLHYMFFFFFPEISNEMTFLSLCSDEARLPGRN
jgi:hypothetical protein